MYVHAVVTRHASGRTRLRSAHRRRGAHRATRSRSIMASVTLEGVRKTFQHDGRELVAVHDVDLHVADGELVVLVGPSGCGKSTTLRMIAGLEPISGGSLKIGDRLVTDVPPKDRDVAMVFQSYALYPHMTGYDNMAFALTLRNVPKREIDARVR